MLPASFSSFCDVREHDLHANVLLLEGESDSDALYRIAKGHEAKELFFEIQYRQNRQNIIKEVSSDYVVARAHRSVRLARRTVVDYHATTVQLKQTERNH